MIYFYIDPKFWSTDLLNLDNWKSWPGYKDGVHCWTLQTYYRLKDAGLYCSLVSKLPNEGIIITHKGNIPDNLRPNKSQLIVCISADWGLHMYSQVNIVQNPAGVTAEGTPRVERVFNRSKKIFVRLWPQAGIIKRDASRKNTFKKIAFIGRDINLHDSLQSEQWETFIADRGLEWELVSDPSRWHDYSGIDATLSVRDFSSNEYSWKPATKLYNSWAAGVIPICSAESAYVMESKSKEDCIIVNSYTELCEAVDKLIQDDEYRASCLDASIKRSADVTFDSITQDWLNIIEKKLVLEHQAWIKKSWFRRSAGFVWGWVGFKVKKLVDSL